jgi:hypothetical protein
MGFFMTTQQILEIEQTPDYWLIVLLRAVRQSDLEQAAEAQHKLKELGVEIRFSNLLREATQ